MVAFGIIVLPSLHGQQPITQQMAPTLAAVYTTIPRVSLRLQIAPPTLHLFFGFRQECNETLHRILKGVFVTLVRAITLQSLQICPKIQLPSLLLFRALRFMNRRSLCTFLPQQTSMGERREGQRCENGRGSSGRRRKGGRWVSLCR